MDPKTVETVKIIITGLLAYIWDKFTRTSATITIKNKHQNLILTEPTIFPLGVIKNPPDTIINPGEVSDPIKLAAGSGHQVSKGMLSYRIINQGRSNSQYLVIAWRVKLSGKNSMSISVNNYISPPLVNMTQNDFDNLFITMHRNNKTRPNEIVRWRDNGSGFIVTGNIDTKSKARIKVTFSQNFQAEVTAGSSNSQIEEVTAGPSEVPQLNNIKIENISLSL